MSEEKTVTELLKAWVETVMADKVMFNAVIDNKLAETIGLKENTLEKTINILRNASKELAGQNISTGTITKILIEKQKGLWKIVVFKNRLPLEQPG
jgi:hypothetical protein